MVESIKEQREVLDSLEELLSPSGAAYIVLEQCNQPGSVRQYVGYISPEITLHCHHCLSSFQSAWLPL